MVPLSVLDLAPIVAGGTARQALDRARLVARQVEQLGFKRFWLAEHHNMPGVASAATALAIAHVAAGTSTIRVGAGGIMLPNHVPLVIAEQFGTLESLYPGRVDLGLGRAPGTDQRTARALRRQRMDTVETFAQDVAELRGYLEPASAGQPVRAIPGEGTQVPIWLLGSSLFSAKLAAALGLPFAFASHFAPGQLIEALKLYRREYKPSPGHPKPYGMAGLPVYAAESDEKATRLFTSVQQQFVNLHRGQAGPLPPPVERIDDVCSPMELAAADHALAEAVIGSPETVERGLQRFVERTRVDEVMVTSMIFDTAACLRSFEILAGVVRSARASVAAERRER
jgi:luciferase family oxidoreductase group 1